MRLGWRPPKCSRCKAPRLVAVGRWHVTMADGSQGDLWLCHGHYMVLASQDAELMSLQ